MPANRGFTYRSRADTSADGVAVVDYLAARYPAFPAQEWAARVEAGRVAVNGDPAQATTVVRAGDLIEWSRPPWQEPPAPASFAILYERDGVLAVAKPSGLPTVPGGGAFLDHTLLSIVRRHYPDATPLHRLGRTTSGIVLFATTPPALAGLSRAWRERQIVKVYRALVDGRPDRDGWSVDVPIGRVPHPLLKEVYAASEAGKVARSDVRVLERREASAVVQVEILTGRPHQIRIHMAASGHPLSGDPLYGAGGLPAPGSGALPGDGGYQLHAIALGFAHPTDGQWTDVWCLPPTVLRVATD